MKAFRLIKALIVGFTMILITLLSSSAAIAANHYFEQPSDYSQDSPERVVVEFGSTWQSEQYEKMMLLLDSAWINSKENPVEFLSAYAFSSQRPIGFYTTGTSRISDAEAKTKFTALLVPSTTRADYDKVQYEVLMTKEGNDWKIIFPSMSVIKTEFCTEKTVESCKE